MDNPIVVVLGPTASGKTRLAVKIASELNSEIISGDSRQVYRNMDIGTGKDYGEYRIGSSEIPFHLIDIVDAGSDYHLTAFMKDFYDAYALVRSKDKVPVFCGGSGLYMEAVLKKFVYAFVPVDFVAREKLNKLFTGELEDKLASLPKTAYLPLADTSTRKRLIRAIEITEYLHKNEFKFPTLPDLNPLVIGINPPIKERRENIRIRLINRLEAGMIEETEALLKTVPAEKLLRYGLEYNFVTRYLKGEMDKATLVSQLTIAIQQFAKRQMTYFRKMEKDGLKINWIENPEGEWEIVNERVKQFARA